MAKKAPIARLTEDQVQNYINAVLQDAVDFMESDLQPSRELADQYYQGNTSLPSMQGRSSVVVDCVRSGVSSVIPSIARIFTQTDTICEFWSNFPQDEKMCKEATVFCNSVYEQFEGYSALIQSATDALKARVGVVKVWLEKKSLPRHIYMSATDMSSSDILSEPVTSQNPTPVPIYGAPPINQANPTATDQQDQTDPNEPGPEDMLESPEQEAPEGEQGSPMMGAMNGPMANGRPMPGPAQLTESGGNVNVFTQLQERVIWHLDPIPPEEFIIDANSTNIYDAQVVAHRRSLTVGDASALGYDVNTLLEYAQGGDPVIRQEDYERKGYTTDNTDNVANIDPLSRTVLLTEAYVWLDEDGDGALELRRIVCAGVTYRVLSDEPVNYIPFAVTKATLQPHVFAPISLAEDLIQDQDAQTAMLRSIIDNASLVNSPRTEANETAVNLDDLKNGQIGAIVRVRQMGQINELTTPPTASQTLPVLQYLQEVSEKRTGITKLNQGLDPDALQSTAKVAAAAAVAASDARIEMMARNIGETGVKALFLTIMRVAMCELQGPQPIKYKQGYTTVDPSLWSDDLGIKINVGLGSGRIDEKKMVLQGLLQFQQQIIQLAGPANPICGWDNLRNSWASLLRLSGIHNTTDYLPYVDPQTVQQLDAQQKASSKQQSDMQIQAGQMQLQIQKQQADAMTAMTQVEMQKANMKYQAEIQRITTHAQTEIQRIQQQYQTQMASVEQQSQASIQQLQGQIAQMRTQAVADLTEARMNDDQKRDQMMLNFTAALLKLGIEQAQIDQAATEANVLSAESRTINGTGSAIQ